MSIKKTIYNLTENNQKYVVFEEIKLIKNKKTLKENFIECSFSQLVLNNINYYNNYSNKKDMYFSFKCHNNGSHIKCNAMLSIKILYNNESKCYYLKLINHTDHNETCLKSNESINKESNDMVNNVVNFVFTELPFLTKSQIGLLFGLEEQELNKVENKLKYKMKDLECSSIDKLLLTKNKYITFNSNSDIVIFCQKHCIECIHHSTQLYCDGTFKCVTDKYKQLFIITSKINLNYFTCALILLKDKKEESYYLAFKKLEEFGQTIIKDFSLQNKERKMMCDFESSIISSLKSFKSLEIIHCSFHFKEIQRRKLNELSFPKKQSVDIIFEDNNQSSTNESSISSTSEEDSSYEYKYSTMLSKLQRKCKKYISEPSYSSSSEEELSLEMDENQEMFETSEIKEIEYNYFKTIEINKYKQKIKLSKSINETNKKEINLLLNNYYKNQKEINTPSLLLNTRSLLKSIGNICYLNQSFNITNICDIIFNETFHVCKVEYHSIIKEYKNYFYSNWVKNENNIKEWNIFNSESTNNISEITNNVLNTDLPSGKSISTPLFLYKVKYLFYQNQRKIILSKSNKLQPQQSRHKVFKESMICLMNYYLFIDRIDCITFLDCLHDIIKIKNYNDRKTVLKNILNIIESNFIVTRKLFILESNYHKLKSFDGEKQKFISYIEENIKNKTLIGTFIDNFIISNDTTIKDQNKSYDSEELDSETIEMLLPKNRLDEILKEFKIKEKEEKQNYQMIEINENEVLKLPKCINDFEKLEKYSSKLSSAKIKELNTHQCNETIDQFETEVIQDNNHSILHISNSEKISRIIPQLPYNQFFHQNNSNEQLKSLMKELMKEQMKEMEQLYEFKRKKEYDNLINTIENHHQKILKVFEEQEQNHMKIFHSMEKTLNEFHKKQTEIEELIKQLKEKENPLK